MEQLHILRQRTTSATKQLFRGPPDTDEPEFLPEDEQAELIESLRSSNEKANDQFKFILLAFSVLEVAAHLGFVVYNQGLAPVMDKDRHQSFSPAAGTLFALTSYGISMLIIKDTSRITRNNLVGWTVVSVLPIALALLGSVAWSFELLWWSMPLMLQALDLASLWIMQDPDEAFVHLEKSQYKLKGA